LETGEEGHCAHPLVSPQSSVPFISDDSDREGAVNDSKAQVAQVHPGRASIARNAVHLVSGQVVTTTLAILFSAALGRSLGAGDFGLYFLVNTFATFAYVVVDCGQQFYVIREVARAPDRGGEFLGAALVTRVIGAVLISAPVGLISWALGYDARTCWFSVAFIFVMLPFFLAQSYGMIFRGRDRMGLDASVSVVNKIAMLALAFAALGLGTGLAGVVVAQALGGCVAIAVATRLYRREAIGRVSFSWEATRRMVAGGAAIVTMVIATSVQPYLDAIILSKLATPDAVGWFGAAKNIMGTLLAPALIIGAAAYPQLSRAASDMAAFKGEVRAALRPMLLLGALAGAGTYLFGDAAIGIVYGERNFGPAGTILKIFGPGLFLLFIDVLLGYGLAALGRTTAFTIVKISSVVVSTALDFVLISIFQRRTGNGGAGAVLAFVLSEVVVLAGAVILMPQGSLRPGVVLDIARAVGAASITAFLFQSLPPIPFYLGIPLCVVMFAVISAALGLVRRNDLAVLRAALRQRRAVPVPAVAEGAGDRSSAA
jgi:O-antigen/teichoic acid export membrane protein